MRTTMLLGPVAALLLLGGLFEDNVPAHSSDRTIDTWLATHGNSGWMLHAISIAIGGLLLIAFAQVLRDQLRRPDTAETTLSRTIGSLGTLVGSMCVVGAALFAAVPVGRFFEHSPAPDAATYRYLMAASASVLVIFVSVAAAALAATTAALGLRAHTMPRWLGYAGVALAALMLVSAFVMPLMVFGVWLVLTGTTLAFSHPRPAGASLEPTASLA